MVSTFNPCKLSRTDADKAWPYHEYYVGEKDEELRKSGQGRHHWSGAESLEWYTGDLLRDTMHGVGEYRCRHRGAENLSFSYEGHFYNNRMHGYGFSSYSDGSVFNGIYHSNLRWGPGVETQARLRENVGLWKGTRLVRLTWIPATPSVAPDLLSTNIGRNIVAKHRSLLVASRKTIGEVNPALELLKQYGAQPLVAAQKWIKLYPNNCTDRNSQLYYPDVFERAYYDNEIVTLVDPSTTPEVIEEGFPRTDSHLDIKVEKFYAWNNNEMVIHIMKHCYQHEMQRSKFKINIGNILNGPRQLFKPAAEHELDCRSLLLACYLGHTKNATQLINEFDVSPNVTDMQGNSALMYATCGNRPDIIHFLIEAGAKVNDYNDACCTPLGVALINYACAEWEITPNNVIKAILPIAESPPNDQIEEVISEWHIERDLSSPVTKKEADASSSKTAKSTHVPVAKKAKSLQSVASKIEGKSETQHLASNLFAENRIYFNLVNEFNIRLNNIAVQTTDTIPTTYIFDVTDLVTEINATEDEQKKISDKKDAKKTTSKIMKDAIKKPSADLALSGLEQDLSLDFKAKMKIDQMDHLRSTIAQLLVNGADPRRTCCPQPALFIAIVSQAPDLIRSLVKYGADVNEVYPQILGYTPLDIAMGQPFTQQNLEVIRTLLELGANPDHRLPINNPDTLDLNYNEPGPTLLHAALARKSDEDSIEEIRHQILEYLLEYGCNPISQYKGRSAMDMAMSKNLDVFDIFIESPRTDLNAVINQSNQTLLLKMFHLQYCKTISVAERLQMLTNLLLFGADPLLKCQNEEEVYENLFVYAKSVLSEIDKPKTTSPATGKHDMKKSKSETKSKKLEKGKNGNQNASKSATGNKVLNTDEVGDYKQSLSLVTNCARLLFIRWIQAKLMKGLIEVVDRFKHRHWNMILKECKNTKRLGIWLNPVRCLEVWDILKTTKNRIYQDKRVLKHVLCIVLYYFKRVKKILRQPTLSSEEKASIESEVAYFVREHNLVTKAQVFKRPYVTPELTHINQTYKFNICFECAVPLDETKITCGRCRLIDFCSIECMEINIDRYNCHPCSSYLQKKYFPAPQFSHTDFSTSKIVL